MKINHINSYFYTNRLHLLLIEKLSHKKYVQNIFVPVNVKDKLSAAKDESVPNAHVEVIHCFNNFERQFWPIKMIKIWKSYKIFKLKNDDEITHAHTLIVNGLIA